MSRYPAVIALGFAIGAVTAFAQTTVFDSEPGAVPAPAAPSTAGAPSQAAKAPATPQAISNQTAAMVDIGRPKYDPPKPDKPAAELPDLRDTDRPKNDIVRLPKYIVHPPKSPVFREQDFHTPRELARLAMTKYQGLNYMPFASLNAPIALSMYRDEQRQKTTADLNTGADSVSAGGDKAESDYIKKQTEDIFLRPFDVGGPLPMQSQPR